MKRRTIQVFAIAALSVSCRQAELEPKPLIRSVRYVVVQRTEDAGERVFSGSLEAGNESRLSFQVAGRIQKLTVKEGERVKKDHLVAELDPTDFRLQLRETSANVAQAKAQTSNADANYQRVRRLYETQNTSRQDLDAARAQRDSARAAYAASLESLSRLKRQLSYTQLHAPADGVVNAVSAEVDEVVGAGRVIIVLQVGDALEASLDVPEAFIRYIGLGDSAKVKVSAVDALVDGVIQEIGVPNVGTGMFPVRVKLMKDSPSARPGMVAEVMLKPREGSMTQTKGFRLPISAIGEDREGRYVYVVDGKPDEEGKVRRVSVQIGTVSSAGIEVTEGVEEGQQVVVAGVSRIQSGMTVKIPAMPIQGAAQ